MPWHRLRKIPRYSKIEDVYTEEEFVIDVEGCLLPGGLSLISNISVFVSCLYCAVFSTPEKEYNVFPACQNEGTFEFIIDSLSSGLFVPEP